MSEDTQTTDVPAQEAQASGAEGQSSVETPSVDLASELAQLKAQVEAERATRETLEKRLDEVNYYYQPQNPQNTPTVDLDAKINDLAQAFDVEDSSVRAQKIKELLNAQKQISEQEAQMQQYYLSKESKIFERKPHFKQLEGAFRNSVRAEVSNGLNLDQAILKVEREFDTQLSPLINQKDELTKTKQEEPKIVHEEKKQPEGTVGSKIQNSTPPPVKEPEAETAAQYLKRRIAMYENRNRMKAPRKLS